MPSVEHEAVVESLNSQRGTDTPATAEEMRAGFEAMADYFEALEFPSEVKQDPVDAGGVPGVWFTPPDARWGCAILYLHGGDLHDPRAAPLHADFSGFPPLLIQVGTREILLDDAKRVTASARAAGVDVVLEEGEGLTHVWQLYPHVPESIDAVERIGRFVLKQIG